MHVIFCKLKKAQKAWIEFFASLKKLKRHGFNFSLVVVSLRSWTESRVGGTPASESLKKSIHSTSTVPSNFTIEKRKPSKQNDIFANQKKKNENLASPLEKTEFPGKNVDCSKKHWEEHTFNFKKYFANHGDSCLFQNSKTSEFCFPIWKKNLAYFDVRGFKPAASAFCFQIL